jgi:hypothetical protein
MSEELKSVRTHIQPLLALPNTIDVLSEMG